MLTCVVSLSSHTFGQNIPAALRGDSSTQVEVKKRDSKLSRAYTANSTQKLSPVKQFKAKKNRRLSPGASFMWAAFIFCILSLFALITIFFLGWWGVLISFGLLLLAAIFYLIGLATGEDLGTILLGGVINAIALSVSAILDVLTYIVFLIVSLV